VPFCFHKCHYCDFYSFVDNRDRQSAFVDALSTELTALAPHAGSLRTIFIGGGTPTLLRPDLFAALLDAIADRFDGCTGEFTVECNPETATPELMQVLAAGGVNRLSVGAQSFNTRHLETLERWHNPESVPRALELARDAGIERRSLDLIFAIPGQTEQEWAADLDIACSLPVDHLSCYALTYEQGTAMTKRLERGDFQPATEDHEARLYEITVHRLRSEGFERYEVSNFARPNDAGGPSAHNLAYWRAEQWLAAGPSASAHVGGHRYRNVPHLTEWMQGVITGDGTSPIIDLEWPDPRRALAERIMMGLRIDEGLETDALLNDAAACDVDDAMRAGLRREADAGWLTIDDRVRLTERGYLMCDGIASRLMSVLETAKENAR
jgi:oxygen-independent coproporphyrinogen-3 oxidase